jgi:hypothetical protein
MGVTHQSSESVMYNTCVKSGYIGRVRRRFQHKFINSYFHKFILKQDWYLIEKEPYQIAKKLVVVCDQHAPPNLNT